MKRLLLIMLLIGTIAACKKEDPVQPPPGGGPVNESELITTLRLHFTSLDSSDQREWVWRDLDGEGGDPPVITTEPLGADVIYTVRIEVLDESDMDDVEDITAEIVEEDAEHQFFFISTGVNATIQYTDQDVNGDPVGVQSLWSLGAASSGTVDVILRHEPNKDAPGVSDGDITNAGGDTDVEVNFPLVIE